ncbi:MAG: DNA polymerase IV [Saprospiraceae bacterium]
MEDFTQYDYQRLTAGHPHQQQGTPAHLDETALADGALALDTSPFKRAILHLDLDSFFISVERLKDSSLIGRPLIVGGRSGRGVVASCSYEARAFGVRSAMPMRMALKLCPEALVIRGDMESYSNYSRLVTDVIADDAPLYEKSSIDEFYCDLTGMDKYVGCWKWSVELRDRVIKETGLPISFGLSVNKLVSKVSTSEAKPNGTLMIRNGLERDFLAPLSAAKLPGLGKKTYHKLSFMGVRTVKLLREIPVRLLEREFGKHGRALARKANAIDESPVVPHSERKSLSKERTFQQDTTDINFLRDVLTDMVTRLAFDLRQAGQLASCITVKIRYTDFQTFTKQRHIAYTSNDRHFMRHANELFDRLHERRQMVRLVGVRFTGLVRGHYQVDLFEDSEREVNLMGAMDEIRSRFGESAIKRARCVS